MNKPRHYIIVPKDKETMKETRTRLFLQNVLDYLYDIEKLTIDNPWGEFDDNKN